MTRVILMAPTVGSVYKQPETEEDNSCHSWRVPSKWKGVQKEVIRNSKGRAKETAPCIYVIAMFFFSFICLFSFYKFTCNNHKLKTTYCVARHCAYR